MMRRVFSLLLRLFPAGFRSVFAADMMAAFEDRSREQRGWKAAFRLISDMLVAALLERLTRKQGLPQIRQGHRSQNNMTNLIQDLRYGLRMLQRSPVFTAVTVATLALAIGMNTAMFSIAYAALWRALPYANPDRIVSVAEVAADNPNNVWGASFLNFRDWQARAKSFDHFAGMMGDERILTSGREPVRISGALVTYDFFDVLGVAPELGRSFAADEDRKGAPPVIVLSHQMWMDRLGGDPDIVGRAISFDGASFSVIGVMPVAFGYRQAEYWMPLEQEIGDYVRTRRNVWMIRAIGRLKEGVSAATAREEIAGITNQLHRDYPETDRGLALRVDSLAEGLHHDLRPALLVLLGAVGVVLLIACSNLAGLMLVRGMSRAREIAIRTALGVSRMRLVRQLLTESALLAFIGGFAGLALSAWGGRAIRLFTDDPRLQNVQIGLPAVAFAAAVTIVTLVLFGIIPALHATRIDLSRALVSRTAAAARKAFAQRILVVAQVACCLVLLVCAGLLLQSFQRLLDVQPGFHAGNLVTMQVSLPSSFTTVSAVTEFYRRVSERLSAIPGTDGVTLVNRLPISGGEPGGDVNLESHPAVAGELGTATFRRILPSYFDVMGIPLILGRTFDDRDAAGHPPSVIINDGFRRRFWRNQDPIGKRIKIGPIDSGPWLTIVGVVGDVRQYGLDSEAPFSTYEPLATQPALRFSIAVRVMDNVPFVMKQMQDEVRAIEHGALIDRVATMSQRIDSTLAPRRLNLILFGLFATLALALAAVGLYGVVAYAAQQRVQEFGIRIALGARWSDVLGLVLGQGLRLALFGAALGIAAAAGLTRFLDGLLFGVPAGDPRTFAGAGVVLIAVALAACLLPALRATRVAPTEALRGE